MKKVITISILAFMALALFSCKKEKFEPITAAPSPAPDTVYAVEAIVDSPDYWFEINNEYKPAGVSYEAHSGDTLVLITGDNNGVNSYSGQIRVDGLTVEHQTCNCEFTLTYILP